MDRLPPELLYQIALESPLETLISLCQSNRFYWNLCADDNFWRNKFLRDYPDYLPFKPESLTFQQAYLDLAQNNAKVIPVLYRRQEIGSFWLTRGADPNEIQDNIFHIFEETVPLEERPDEALVEYETVSGIRNFLTFLPDQEVAFVEVVPGRTYLRQRRGGDDLPEIVTLGRRL